MNEEEKKLVNGSILPKKHYEKFLGIYVIDIVKNVKLKKNAKKVINYFKSEGHEIYFITARTKDKHKDIIDSNIEYLNRYGINYDKIIFSKEKAKECQRYKIDLMIDDSISHLEAISRLKVDVLLFASKNSKNYNGLFKIVNNWLEIKDYVDSKR